MPKMSAMASNILRQIISGYPFPDKVKMRDTKQLGKMLDNLMAKGPDSLQVITDFDFTLTKTHLPDGTPASTGPGVMNNSPLMSEDFRQKVTALSKHYRPIEFDHSIPVEQKIPMIEEWYQKRKDIVIAAKVKKSQIEEMVSNCNVVLRDGVKETLKKLNDAKVPVLVFSAGNGDIIEGVMKKDGALFPNTHVIANFFKYDDDGYVIDYMNPTLLHVFNKNEHALENSSYFDDLIHRPNALLLGDHIADANMAEGMPQSEIILKVGFLNGLSCENEKESLLIYEKNFDVVLINDPTFQFIDSMLKFVLQKP